MRLFFWLVAFALFSAQVFCADEIDFKDPLHNIIPTTHFEKMLLESDREFTVQDQDAVLELFKYAGRNIDGNPQRSLVCKQALDRFIKTFPTYPLSEVLYGIISGISYSPPNQMTDFYLTGIGKVYAEAVRRYYPHDKIAIFNSVKMLFGVIHDIPDYKRLMNTVLAGLLEKECITPVIAETLTRQQMSNGKQGKGPQWLNQDNENRLWPLLVDNASK